MEHTDITPKNQDKFSMENKQVKNKNKNQREYWSPDNKRIICQTMSSHVAVLT
jgi:hypothetical protein